MKYLITAAFACLWTPAALAEEVIYILTGNVDLTGVASNDLSALALASDTSAPLAVTMIIDRSAVDTSPVSTLGTFRADMTRIAIGSARVTDPERSARSIVRRSQNMVFRVSDSPPTDGLSWEYTPLGNGKLSHLDRITASLTFDPTILSRDTLPIDPALAGQMLQNSTGAPFIRLRTVKNATYTLPISNARLTIEVVR